MKQHSFLKRHGAIAFAVLGCLTVTSFAVTGFSVTNDAAKSVSQKHVNQPTSGTQASSLSPIELRQCWIKLKKKATLASGTPGILKTIDLEEGAIVKKGEVVAQLKDGPAVAALAVAKKNADNNTSIDYTKKAAAQAKVELDIANQVNENQPGTVTKVQIQRLELEWEKSKASIEKAIHEKEVAGKQMEEKAALLKAYKITAPFDGVVVKKFKTAGEAVRQGDPILEIVNTKVVTIEGYIDYKDRKNISVGNTVSISIEDSLEEKLPKVPKRKPSKTYPGKIVFIDQTVNKLTRKFFIKVDVPNPDGNLAPGLTARMLITPNKR